MKTPLNFLEPPVWPASIVIGGEWIEVIGRWHFLVRSKTEGGWHCIDLESVHSSTRSGDLYVEYQGGCTCTSWRVRGTCRHMDVVKAKWLVLAPTPLSDRLPRLSS